MFIDKLIESAMESQWSVIKMGADKNLAPFACLNIYLF